MVSLFFSMVINVKVLVSLSTLTLRLSLGLVSPLFVTGPGSIDLV